MTEAEAKSLFILAGLKVNRVWKLQNQYWPEVDDYLKIRAMNPWWLVMTEYGLVELGWRKRVVSIDWSATDVRAVVTTDDVTKCDTLVHAWNLPDAVKYLTNWRVLAAEQSASKLAHPPQPVAGV